MDAAGRGGCTLDQVRRLDGKLYAVGAGAERQAFDRRRCHDPPNRWLAAFAGQDEHCTLWVGAGASVARSTRSVDGWQLDNQVGRAYDPPRHGLGASRAKRYRHARCADGKIYVMGGFDGAGKLDRVGLRPSGRQLAAGGEHAARPVPSAALVMGGKIYVTGGETGDDQAVNSVRGADAQTDAWAQLANMGTARQFHASAAVGGKLYVFGGQGGEDDDYLSTAEVYDPASDSWAQVTSLTSARRIFVAAAL